MNLKAAIALIFFIGIAQVDFAQSITYSIGPNLSVARTEHEMQPLPDGKVLIMGGNNGSFQNYIYHNSCEVYNPVSNAFEVVSAMKDKRSGFMSEVLPNGNIIVIGGNYAQQLGRYSCEIFNVATKTWTYTDSLNASHAGGRSVKLNDGRILVAGGYVTNSEVYDSYLNEWSFVGDMNVVHGEGMSLTLLKNGNVLAIGGKGGPKFMEIFSPITNSWTSLQTTTYYNRYGHGAVLMPNGKVFIAGSGNPGSDEQRYSEMFDPSNNIINKNGTLRVNTFYNQLIVLDNGKVLTFGFGDLFDPYNTKIFQEYNPTSQIWSASDAYNTLGATDYTMKKLSNGQIFIVGGNATTGNGASLKTYLVSQTGYTACLDPDLTGLLSAASINNCYGNSAKIKLSTTNAASTYYVYSGQNNIGSFTTNGETNVEYTIPSKFLSLGKNVISLQIAKTGCITKKIIDTAIIDIKSINSILTTISKTSGADLLCNTGSAIFQVNNPLTIGTYQWYNATSGNQINVNESALVTAYHVDANGCIGKPSEPYRIRRILPTDFKSHVSLTVCNSDMPIQLTASPPGGTWTGAGVSTSGLFTPANATIGNSSLIYSLCGYTTSKSVTVSSKNLITYNSQNITWPKVDTLCGGANYVIQPNGLNVNYKTLFYVNNVLKQTSVSGNSFIVYYTPEAETQAVLTFKITNFWSGACANDTLVISKSYVVAPKPSSIISSAIIPDTWCTETNVKISIVHPQIGVGYYATYYPENEENRGVKIKVNQAVDTLVIYSGGGPNHITVYATPNMGCTNKVYLAQKDIVVFQQNNELALGNVYYIGETVQPVLVSNMDSFKWTIDGTHSTLKNPPAKVYNSLGTHEYKVISISKFGCSDTLHKEVSIVNKPPLVSLNICLFDTSKIETFTDVFRSVIDRKGNPIYVGSFYSEFGGKNSGSENAFIEKYDKNNGSVLWSIKHDPFTSYEKDFYSIIVNAITCDDNNDIYVTGMYASKKMKFAGVQIENPEYEYPYCHVFVAKISEGGQLVWFNTSSYLLDDPNRNGLSDGAGGTDILYVNNKLILSARILNQSVWKNKNGQVIPVTNPEKIGEYVIFEMNLDGSSIKALATLNEQNYIGVQRRSNIFGLCNIRGGSSGFHTLKFGLVSPLIKSIPNNKIIIHGTMKETVIFGSFVLTAPTANGVSLPTEFTSVLNLNTNTWESAKMEASIEQPIYESFNMLGYVKLGAVYNQKLEKFSAFNYGFEFAISTTPPKRTVYIDASHTETYEGTAVLLKKTDQAGNLKWKQLIKGANAEQIFISSDDKQIIVVGEYIFGASFLYKNQNYGLTYTSHKDIYAMGFDAENGNLIWSEKVGSRNFDDEYVNAALSSCNDLVIMAYRRNFYLADVFDAVGHESDSLRYYSSYPYIIRFPLTGICGSTNCSLLTTDVSNGNNFFMGQIVIFPNPTSKKITIKSPSKHALETVVITNLQGSVVKMNKMRDEIELDIDVSDLIPGVYIVETIIEGQRFVDKMYIIR